MAIVIARRKLPARIRAGQIIQDGTAAASEGVLRIGATSNWALATRSHQLIHEFYHPVYSFAAADVLPVDQAHGARWWARITPGWTAAVWYVLCRTDPNDVNSEITVHSRASSDTITIDANSFSWFALDSGSLTVSATGIEEFYFDVTPGVAETVEIKAVSASEIAKATL